MSSKMLYLWSATEQGNPNTHAEARAIFTRLMDDESTQPEQLSLTANTKPQTETWVMEFARHLQQIALSAQKVPLEGRRPFMHCHTYLAEQAHDNLLALELPNIPESTFLPMLLEIINLARQLNLVALDDSNLGIYFLPSGDILPKEKEDLWLGYIEYWESQSDITFNNITEFKNYIEPFITEIMKDQDFVLNYTESIENSNNPNYMYEYSKKVSICYYQLNFYLDTKKYGYRLSARICLYLNIPELDYSKIPFIEKWSDRIKSFNGLSMSFPLTSFMDENNLLTNELDSIKNTRGVDRIIPKLKAKILPLLPLINENIDDLVVIIKKSNIFKDNAPNPKTMRYIDGVTPIPHLLFALRLANDSQFDELVEAATHSIKNSSKPFVEEEFLAFVKFLREEVKPLV